MTDTKAQELISKAESYFGKEIIVQAKSVAKNTTETKIYIFVDIQISRMTTKISSDPNYNESDIYLLAAKLENKDSGGDFIFESLKDILAFFEKE
jgi:hypothetical protein